MPSQSKEYPILMKGEMVRAILSGQKTQTRRTNLKTKYPVGDRLWVKETHRQIRAWQGSISGCEIEYRADGATKIFPEIWAVPKKVTPWTPSLFMRRELSRVLLEITDLREEPLTSISEEDAEAESVDFLRNIPDADETLTARTLYKILWDSINGESSFASDPRVKVISFKVVKP